jgi:hypothetical protein
MSLLDLGDFRKAAGAARDSAGNLCADDNDSNARMGAAVPSGAGIARRGHKIGG